MGPMAAVARTLQPSRAIRAVPTPAWAQPPRERLVQPRRAGDGCQRPLVPRSRCPPRLTPSVVPLQDTWSAGETRKERVRSSYTLAYPELVKRAVPKPWSATSKTVRVSYAADLPSGGGNFMDKAPNWQQSIRRVARIVWIVVILILAAPLIWASYARLTLGSWPD